jgi:hypothetical protein
MSRCSLALGASLALATTGLVTSEPRAFGTGVTLIDATPSARDSRTSR